MKALSTLLFFLFSFAVLSQSGPIKAGDKEPSEEPDTKAKSADWDLVEKDGQSYVTSANLATFYQFPIYSVDKEAQSARFRYRSVELKLNSDGTHRWAEINRNRFALLNETIWDEENERILIHSTDLTYVIEPMIRPSHIRNENWTQERDRPIHFTLDGEPALIEAFGIGELNEEAESRGLRVVTDEDRKNAVSIEIILQAATEKGSSTSVSTHWFWRQKDRESSGLSIAAGASLHSHLTLVPSLKDKGLRPVKVDPEGGSNPRTRIEFVIKDDFPHYPKIHSAIADAIIKMRKAAGKRGE